MSMISEQVRRLRKLAYDCACENTSGCHNMYHELMKAADTIEVLSAKVREQNLHGVCNWCANLDERRLRIEYYWIDDEGNTASFTGKDTHVIATGIARFCPCCGRYLGGEDHE